MKTTTAQNTVGTWFKLDETENGTALVCIRCANYSLGRVSYTWRVVTPHQRMTNPEFQAMCRNGLPMTEAHSLFTKKLKGKSK
jgi:hypothetical protein